MEVWKVTFTTFYQIYIFVHYSIQNFRTRMSHYDLIFIFHNVLVAIVFLQIVVFFFILTACRSKYNEKTVCKPHIILSSIRLLNVNLVVILCWSVILLWHYSSLMASNTLLLVNQQSCPNFPARYLLIFSAINLKKWYLIT